MRNKFLSWLFPGNPEKSTPATSPPVPPDAQLPDHPVAFGYKCAWLAVPTADTDRLAQVFHLMEPAPCNWARGIEAAYERWFFVSPPVEGWSFIVSRKLPFAENDTSVATLKAILLQLSEEFGEAQYFGTYRVVGYDGWMKAVNGQLQRAYAFVEAANTIVEGVATPIERTLDLVNTLSAEAEADPDYLDKHTWPDEEITMQVAGAWSINPQELDNRQELAPGMGLLGDWKEAK